MNFSEKLIRLRKREGISQEELASYLEVSRQAVSRWEQGTDPMLDTGVLSACGATQYSGEEKEPLLMSTTTRLVQDGWFIGRSLDDIYQLYYFDRNDQTVYATQLDATHTLRLTVQGNTCTAAELLTA